MRQFFVNLVARARKPNRGFSSRSERRHMRLQLESLEDRLSPSGFLSGTHWTPPDPCVLPVPTHPAVRLHSIPTNPCFPPEPT
jgi:hypothetical protein